MSLTQKKTSKPSSLSKFCSLCLHEIPVLTFIDQDRFLAIFQKIDGKKNNNMFCWILKLVGSFDRPLRKDRSQTPRLRKVPLDFAARLRLGRCDDLGEPRLSAKDPQKDGVLQCFGVIYEV